MRPDSQSQASTATATSAAAPEPLKLRARILSAIVLAPLALGAAWAGGPAFAGLIAAAAVILAREWTRMSDPQGGDQAFAIAAAGAAGGVIAAAFTVAAPTGDAIAQAARPNMALAWSWIVVAAAAAGIERVRRGGGAGPAIAAALGVVYVSAPCTALVWLRLAADDGAERVTYLFACVWAADTGAFLAGNLIGGPRLWAEVSPKKTWAGLFVGAALAGVAGGALAWYFAWPDLVSKTAGAVALGAAALGGDLLESALKRRYGVKDAGALIPGHGGLLDRVDGLMLAAVVHATKVVLWP